VDKLFGAGHQLTERSRSRKPGQFACHETVTLVGPKRRIEGVRVLGPLRRADQVEIARTDEFFLGLDAPVRDSGDTVGTRRHHPRGARGLGQLPEGLICARRHIHMHPTTPRPSASPTATWWRWRWTPRGATSSSVTC
jgi:acetate kinase